MSKVSMFCSLLQSPALRIMPSRQQITVECINKLHRMKGIKFKNSGDP